jgi:hypothetical protein
VTKSTKIGHPKKGEGVRWKKDARAKFVAFGQATADVGSVQGKLVDAKGAAVPGVVAKTLRQPTPTQPFWVILFTEVPYTDASRNETYTLHVYDGADHLEQSENVTVTLIPGGSFTILYPATNGNVCPSFTAYGQCDTTDPVTCRLVKGGTTVSGQQTTSSDPNVWVSTFLNAPQDTYDELTATSDAGSATPSDNITVNGVYCQSGG